MSRIWTFSGAAAKLLKSAALLFVVLFRVAYWRCYQSTKYDLFDLTVVSGYTLVLVVYNVFGVAAA